MLDDTASQEALRRTKVRRSAILLGIVALSFYAAFIVMSVMRS
ncbi:MAG TPA: hypothetical protein VGO61_08245 [Steroidobacteraceae bacterium]|jgi:hypothetical protein|nr:hypothetical protein [Steroidobacteraceae bacterium]